MRTSDKKKNISKVNLLLEVKHRIEKEGLPDSVELIVRDIMSNEQEIVNVEKINYNIFKVTYNNSGDYNSIFTVKTDAYRTTDEYGTEHYPAEGIKFVSVDILLQGKIIYSDRVFFQDIFNKYLSSDIFDLIVNEYPADKQSQIDSSWEEKREKDNHDWDRATDNYWGGSLD